MSDPKLELIMQTVVTKAQAIEVSGNAVFPYVTRQTIVGQALSSSNKPALGVQRLLDRNDRAYESYENQKTRLVLQFQVVGSQTDKSLVDAELVQLREHLDTTFLNCTLNGLVEPIRYFGADTSNFAAVPIGTELVCYETAFAKPKPAFHA